jgi:hypothetical protein
VSQLDDDVFSAVKLVDDLPFGDDSGSAAGSSGFGHSFRMFPGGSSSMGVEVAGGEAFMACAGARVAPTTAVVGAVTTAALSSDVGVKLAEGEALTARARAVAAWTRAELGAATPVASPPSLTVARWRAQERLRLLLAQASQRFLLCARLLSLAGRRPGCREGGGVFWSSSRLS